MADPVYEVKLKDVQSDTTPVTPTMSEEEIESLVDSKATARAEQIANEKVEKLKESLAESITGRQSASRYGKNGPESWDKLHEEIAEDATARAVRIAEEKIEQRLAAEKKAVEDREKLTQRQVQERQEAEYARISNEWKEAVSDGILPDISPDVKNKLIANQNNIDALTEEDRKDPGLRAYNESLALHTQLMKEGKSNSFYRTVTQFYRKQPAGARAPVIGGGASNYSSGGDDVDYDYAEIARNRKAKFNIG